MKQNKLESIRKIAKYVEKKNGQGADDGQLALG
jgi:hypothetical protein